MVTHPHLDLGQGNAEIARAFDLHGNPRAPEDPAADHVAGVVFAVLVIGVAIGSFAFPTFKTKFESSVLRVP